MALYAAGDTVAAMLALDEFVRQAISMVYLLNRTYMPYYKWMFRGMETSDSAGGGGKIRSFR